MQIEERVEDRTAEYTYDFGKHWGKTLREVQTEDAGYAAWCMLNGVHHQRPTWRDTLVAADLWETVREQQQLLRQELRKTGWKRCGCTSKARREGHSQ